MTTTTRVEFHDTYATENAAEIDVVLYIPELGRSVTCRMLRSSVFAMAREALVDFGKDVDDYRMIQFGEHLSEELEAVAEMVGE